GRNHVLAASGTTPRRAKTKPMRAAEDAIRMSIGRVSVMPKPTAGPLIAAITGFFMSKILRVTVPPPSRCSSAVAARPRAADALRAAGRRGAGAPAAEARLYALRAAGRRGAGAPPAEARLYLNVDPPAPRSAPAQNARPAPVTMTA